MRSPHRRAVPALLAGTLLIAACGGSDDAEVVDSEPASTETPVDTEAPATDAPVETAAPETDAPATDAPVDTAAPATDAPADTAAPATDGGVASGTVDAALSEWAIDAPTEYASGSITFNATNGGSFPHELVVIAGEGYESLPLEEGGKVIEEELPTGALIGCTDRISSGTSAELTVDLAPGSYVLVCNLGGGSNSHAGAGQRLDITVTG